MPHRAAAAGPSKWNHKQVLKAALDSFECKVNEFDRDKTGVLNDSELYGFIGVLDIGRRDKAQVSRWLKYDAPEADASYLEGDRMTTAGLRSFYKKAANTRLEAVIKDLNALQIPTQDLEVKQYVRVGGRGRFAWAGIGAGIYWNGKFQQMPANSDACFLVSQSSPPIPPSHTHSPRVSSDMRLHSDSRRPLRGFGMTVRMGQPRQNGVEETTLAPSSTSNPRYLAASSPIDLPHLVHAAANPCNTPNPIDLPPLRTTLRTTRYNHRDTKAYINSHSKSGIAGDKLYAFLMGYHERRFARSGTHSHWAIAKQKSICFFEDTMALPTWSFCPELPIFTNGRQYTVDNGAYWIADTSFDDSEEARGANLEFVGGFPFSLDAYLSMINDKMSARAVNESLPNRSLRFGDNAGYLAPFVPIMMERFDLTVYITENSDDGVRSSQAVEITADRQPVNGSMMQVLYERTPGSLTLLIPTHAENNGQQQRSFCIRATINIKTGTASLDKIMFTDYRAVVGACGRASPIPDEPEPMSRCAIGDLWLPWNVFDVVDNRPPRVPWENFGDFVGLELLDMQDGDSELAVIPWTRMPPDNERSASGKIGSDKSAFTPLGPDIDD